MRLRQGKTLTRAAKDRILAKTPAAVHRLIVHLTRVGFKEKVKAGKQEVLRNIEVFQGGGTRLNNRIVAISPRSCR